MNNLVLQVSSDGTWSLNGELTFTLLSQKYTSLSKQLPQSGAWHIDCDKLTRVDTCGIAFLLICVRHANTHDIKLRISSINRTLKELMQIQGVIEIFNPYLEKHI